LQAQEQVALLTSLWSRTKSVIAASLAAKEAEAQVSFCVDHGAPGLCRLLLQERVCRNMNQRLVGQITRD